MDYTMCYLEIFDKETNQWEYLPASQFPEPINLWYNNLDTFFDSHNLFFLFRTIENEGQSSLFTKYKGLPIDCSKPIKHAYYFFTEEVKVCFAVSFLKLSELFAFDYSKTINLKEISETELDLVYPDIYNIKKETITHKQWLGDDYFTELEQTRHLLDKYPGCRLVYFLYNIDLS